MDWTIFFLWKIKKEDNVRHKKNPSFPAVFYPSTLSAGWVDGSNSDIRLEWVSGWEIGL